MTGHTCQTRQAGSARACQFWSLMLRSFLKLPEAPKYWKCASRSLDCRKLLAGEGGVGNLFDEIKEISWQTTSRFSKLLVEASSFPKNTARRYVTTSLAARTCSNLTDYVETWIRNLENIDTTFRAFTIRLFHWARETGARTKPSLNGWRELRKLVIRHVSSIGCFLWKRLC